MKKIIKIIFSFFVFINFLLFSQPEISIAKTNSTHQIVRNNIVANSTNIDITVNENGIYHVEQNIEAEFQRAGESHGLEVYIPYNNTMKINYEGKEYVRYYNTPISNINVENYKYQEEEKDGYLIIRIGDKDKTVSGILNYKFSYDIQMQDLGIGNLQIFYYNILGIDWNMPFKKVNFKVSFPKDVENKENISFYVGKYKSNYAENISYSWDNDKTLIGHSNSEIPAKTGITAELQLSSGYLNLTVYREYVWPGIVVSIITLLFILYKFMRYGRDRQIVSVTNFYPPRGLDSDVIGAIENLKVDNRNVVSQILLWAKKGYIKIELDNMKNIILTKIKEIDSTKLLTESKLFNKIFKNNNSVFVVKKNSLDFKTISDYREELFTYVDDNYEIVDRKTIFLQKICGALAILGFIMTMFFEFNVVYVGGNLFTRLLIFLVIYVVVQVIIQILLKISAKLIYNKLYVNIFLLIFSVLLIITTYSFIYYYKLNMLVIIQPILLIIQLFFTVHMTNWTEDGARLYGEILGFKDFLIKAEKEKLEMLLEENPSYFYDILPYAYSLGLTNIWVDKFKTIDFEVENTYIPTYWDYYMFSTLTRSFDNMESKLDTSSLSSGKNGGGSFSGGGFGGGGFSGGGFGGGGGGSW